MFASRLLCVSHVGTFCIVYLRGAYRESFVILSRPGSWSSLIGTRRRGLSAVRRSVLLRYVYSGHMPAQAPAASPSPSCRTPALSQTILEASSRGDPTSVFHGSGCSQFTLGSLGDIASRARSTSARPLGLGVTRTLRSAPLGAPGERGFPPNRGVPGGACLHVRGSVFLWFHTLTLNQYRPHQRLPHSSPGARVPNRTVPRGVATRGPPCPCCTSQVVSYFMRGALSDIASPFALPRHAPRGLGATHITCMAPRQASSASPPAELPGSGVSGPSLEAASRRDHCVCVVVSG
jgi:hypothetical protein